MRGLAITSLDDTILVIFWVPPDMHSGFITSFLIKIYDLRERRLVTDDMTSDGEVTSYTASDLGKREIELISRHYDTVAD